MTNEQQAIVLLKQLLDAWCNADDVDDVLDIVARIQLFLETNERPSIDNSGRPVGFECCGDPGDCDCLEEPGYGSGI